MENSLITIKKEQEFLKDNLHNKDMEILLVVPKYTYNNFTTKKNFHYTFPVGLAYISAVMKQAGFNVDVINLNHEEGFVADILTEKLNSKKYDLICTGHTGIGCPIIEKITHVIRTHQSKPKILLGGALITSEPKLMADILDFDFAIVGEGEITVVELLNALKNNGDVSKVSGLIIKDKLGNKIFTNPRGMIKNLDILPIPDFDSLGYEEYLDNMSCNDQMFGEFDHPRTYFILGRRGCAFKCTFCYHSIGESYSKRSIESIINEIRYAIKKYKINSIYFYDDLFNVRKEEMLEFCYRIKEVIDETPWKFKWACQSWVGGVDKHILQTMKDSGCSWVCFGLESYNRSVLKSMDKPTTPQQIDDTIKALKEIGMNIMGNFIFGDKAETVETAYNTLDYWEKNCEGQVQLYFIQQYPGSVLYNMSVEKGLIKDKEDFIKNMMTHNIYMNMTDSMTDEEYKQLQKDVYKAVRKHIPHVVPKKIIYIPESDGIYNIELNCPYCKEDLSYKNFNIKNKKFFTCLMHCRHCPRRFYVVSRLYKFSVDYYYELDFLRRNYLKVRDKILRSRV